MVLDTRNFTHLKLIIESMGMPEAVREITEIAFNKLQNIHSIINNNQEVFKIEINKNETKFGFFNNLLIIITIINSKKNDTSTYVPLMNNWNDVDKIYDTIILQINALTKDNKNVKELIVHELTHAYTDYKQKLNSNIGFNERNPNYVTFNTDELIKIRNKFNENEKLEKLIFYLYYLMQIEINANVVQLYYELEKVKKLAKYKKGEDEYNAIKNGGYKNLKYYQIYLIIYNESEHILNSLTQNELNLFKEYVQHSVLNSIYSADDNVFKKKMMEFFKNKSTMVMRKMIKVTMEYIDYYKLLDKTNESISTWKKIKDFK